MANGMSNAKDVVIVSSWRRANYLQICLDALLHARGIQDKQVWIFQNDREDPEIDLKPVHEVIANMRGRFSHYQVFSQSFPSAVLSHCDAWQRAYASNAQKAYFIVDDAIVAPDFFEWHEAVQADGDWFGSTAWRPDGGNTKPFDIDAYYRLPFPNEIAVGLCLKRDSIGIALESTPDWYPLDRVKNWKIAVPFVQRVYHVGEYSSHLGAGRNTGSAIDALPNPIPDYGTQKVIFKP